VNSFENFLSDIGPRPSKFHTVERKDNSLGYSKENCKWATRKEQSRNVRNNRWIQYKNYKFILTDWAKIFKVNDSTLTKMIKRKGFEETYKYYEKKYTKDDLEQTVMELLRFS
jgi:hypothetical protein